MKIHIKKVLNYMYMVIYIFAYIYAPRFVSFNTTHILCIIAVISLCFHINTFRLILERSSIRKFLSVALLGGIEVIFSCWLNGNPIQFYRFFVLCFELPVCATYIASFFYRKKMTIYSLIDVLISVGVLQGLIAILMLFIPSFKQLINQHYFQFWDSRYIGWSQSRMYGFSDNLLHTTPIIQSVIALICIVFRPKDKRNMIFIPILLVSAFVNTRTSAVVFVVGLGSVLLIEKKNLIFSVFKVLFYSVLFFAAFFMIIPFFSEGAYSYFRDGLKEIVFFVTGYVSENSFFYVLFQRFFVFPKNLLGVLFGYGVQIQVLTAHSYGVHSDIGYINDIWTGGIVFCIIILIAYYGMIKSISKMYIKEASSLAVILCVAFSLGHIKGLVTCLNDISALIILLVAANPLSEKIFLFGKNSSLIEDKV